MLVALLEFRLGFGRRIVGLILVSFVLSSAICFFVSTFVAYDLSCQYFATILASILVSVQVTFTC